jgi:uncharacterized membrane protein (UPF0127 family)
MGIPKLFSIRYNPLMYRTMIFRTLEDQATGLQHRGRIEPDVLFVFPYIKAGDGFHSRNVPEPFDIAYVSEDMHVLRAVRVTPPYETDVAPQGTFMAIEAKAGNLEKWGFLDGKRVSF